MGDEAADPIVQRIGEDHLDRLVSVEVGGRQVDMPLREALSRAGAVENLDAMRAEIVREQQNTRLGRQISSLVRDGRHSEAEVLIRRMAGVGDEPQDEPEEDLPPSVQRRLAALQGQIEELSKREHAKATETRIEDALMGLQLFKASPLARERAKDEVLARLVLNPEASIEQVARDVHTSHVRYLEGLEQSRAEQREAAARETRSVAGAGGTPEIVQNWEKPTYAEVKDPSKRANLVERLLKVEQEFARARSSGA